MNKKRLLHKEGFTLAELLIVVAIIGVLVAISIPIFTSQLEKARLATNQANARSAEAAAIAVMMEDQPGTRSVSYDTKTGVATTNGKSNYNMSIETYYDGDSADWTVKTKTRTGNEPTLSKKVFTKWVVLFNDKGEVTGYYLPESYQS